MSAKTTKSKVKVTSDLVARCLHHLDELNVPYVVLIEGIPSSFTNSSPLHAQKIVERQYMLDNKVEEYDIEAAAEKQTGWRAEKET